MNSNKGIEIGEYRLIPEGTEIWPISRPDFIELCEDTIVEIVRTCHGSDLVFVKPKQVIFNLPGFIPGIIGLGSDEWCLSYSLTLPYQVPKYQSMTWSYDGSNYINKKKKNMKIYVYFKNGNVYEYEVASAEKAREHAEKIWTSGYRVKVGDRHEWFGPHYIDKICWDGVDDTYLGRKYGE